MSAWEWIRGLLRRLVGARESEAKGPGAPVPTAQAPSVGRRALPDDLLQFPAGQRVLTTDIVIGLDFGTSCCKVAVQSPLKLGGRVIFAEFGELAHRVSELFIPVTLYEGSDGELSLREPGLVAAIHRHLKIGLLHQPGATTDVHRAAIMSAAYLGLVLREVRRFFLSSQGEIYGADRLRWSLNLGIPSAGYDDGETRRRFALVAQAAWALSLRPELPTLAGAEQALAEVRPGGLDGVTIDVIPEVAAQVVGYAKSRQRQPGLHLLLDVGASTLDLCAFSLHTVDGEDGYALLTADVQPLGLLELHRRRVSATGSRPPFADTPDDLVEPLPDWDGGLGNPCAAELRACDLEFTEATRKVLWRSLADLRRRRDPHSPQWRDGLPLFVCGGGAGSRIVADARGSADRTARGIWDPYAGLRVMSLPTPPVAASPEVLRRMDFARLSVAYGLSFPAINIGTIEPPAEIEDISPELPQSQWKSKYLEN